MKILIHDLEENPFQNLDEDFEIINTRVRAAPCQGCFQCWTKHAGYCVYGDSLQHSGAAIGNSERIIVVSQLCYGGYSAPVKRFFDRGISESLPFLTYRNRKTYHISRYKTRRKLEVYFYGSCDRLERETAREYVECQAVNLNMDSCEVVFINCAEELRRRRL